MLAKDASNRVTFSSHAACNLQHTATADRMTSLSAPIDLLSLGGDTITSGQENLSGVQCRMIGWVYFAPVAAATGDAAYVAGEVRHLHTLSTLH